MVADGLRSTAHNYVTYEVGMALLMTAAIFVAAGLTALFGYFFEALVVATPGFFLLAYWIMETKVSDPKIDHDEVFKQQLMVEQTKLIRNIDRRDDLRG